MDHAVTNFALTAFLFCRPLPYPPFRPRLEWAMLKRTMDLLSDFYIELDPLGVRKYKTHQMAQIIRHPTEREARAK